MSTKHLFKILLYFSDEYLKLRKVLKLLFFSVYGEKWYIIFSSPPRWCHWNLLRSFKVCSDAKRACGAKSNGKLPYLFIPSKTATLVPEFAVEDLYLDRTAALVPEFAVKDLPLGRTLMMMMMGFVIDLRI